MPASYKALAAQMRSQGIADRYAPVITGHTIRGLSISVYHGAFSGSSFGSDSRSFEERPLFRPFSSKNHRTV